MKLAALPGYGDRMLRKIQSFWAKAFSASNIPLRVSGVPPDLEITKASVVHRESQFRIGYSRYHQDLYCQRNELLIYLCSDTPVLYQQTEDLEQSHRCQ